DRLRARVTPTAFVCRAQNQIVVFSKRYPVTLAVYLGGGCDQHSLALLGGKTQDDIGPADVCFDRIYRTLHNQLDPNRRSQVIDYVAGIDELGSESVVSDRVDVVCEVRMVLDQRNVLD